MLSYVVPVVLKKPIVVLKDNRDNKGQQCHTVCISESYQLIFCILLKETIFDVHYSFLFYGLSGLLGLAVESVESPGNEPC